MAQTGGGKRQADVSGPHETLSTAPREFDARPRHLDAEARKRISADNARKIAKTLKILAE